MTNPLNAPKRALRTTGLSMYLPPDELRAARAAYLADWIQGGRADTFGRWIGHALVAHARRTTAQRAQLERPAPQAIAKTGESRRWSVPLEAVSAMRTAIDDDNTAGRFPSKSAWFGDALAAAVDHSRRNNGGILPDPPHRLPTRLARATQPPRHALEL